MVASLRVQVVLYGQEFVRLARLANAVCAAARQARLQGTARDVGLAFGDCYVGGTLDDHQASSLRERCATEDLSEFSYIPFEENLGHGPGHNRLAESSASDVLIVLNPDTYPSPGLFAELLSVLTDPGIGITEAKQIPLEHPKVFDLVSGDTGWASGCCFAIRRETFRALGGFDPAFILHCDDVDLSWRVRLEGLRIVCVTSAVVFHDKRLSAQGYPVPGPAEAYHSSLGRLLLAWKAQRSDVLASWFDQLGRGSPDEQRALSEFHLREAAGTLPDPYPDSSIPTFVGGEFAPHRF